MATTGITFALLITLFLAITGASKAQLSPNFYSATCPNFFAIVRQVVNAQMSIERRIGASLLRLHYVDCFVNGCDASILLDDNATSTGEKNASMNVNSLRGFEVIDAIKARLEFECPGVVSCADILTVAARDGVVNLGGPYWSVAVGRRDSTFASAAAVISQLPGHDMDHESLTSAFSRKGFTVRDMVALSGAHTIGLAQCQFFRDRIYNESNIDTERANDLKQICPVTGGDDNLAPLDVGSPMTFDNNYFKNLVNLRGLLHSDQQLFGYGGSTDPIVTAYIRNSASFSNDFARAMVKMSNLSPLTGTNGQIRRDCRRIN